MSRLKLSSTFFALVPSANFPGVVIIVESAYVVQINRWQVVTATPREYSPREGYT